jgi:hypothetical protein
MKTLRSIAFLYGFATLSALAQHDVDQLRPNNVEQLVVGNIEFFEHLLTSVASLSGVQREDYLQHLKMNKSQERIIVETATRFKAREDMLRQTANAMLLQSSGAEQFAALGEVRAQRNQLLLQSAMSLMKTLDGEGAGRLADRLAHVNALKPKLSGH